MKWLATAFLCVLAMPLLAQEQEQNPMGSQQFPMIITCVPGSPDQMLNERYEEIPFVEGVGVIMIPGDRTINGEFKMYLSPNGDSFTIVLNPIPDLSCIVMSGHDIVPSFNKGDGI